MTEIRYIRMQLLPFNMGVYGELVFIELCLFIFIYPRNLSIKKFTIMLRAVLHGDFPWMHREDKDIDRFSIRHHMLIGSLWYNLSTSLPSLCIQGKSPCSTALSIIANIFSTSDRFLVRDLNIFNLRPILYIWGRIKCTAVWLADRQN